MVHTSSNRNVVGTGPDASRNGSYQCVQHGVGQCECPHWPRSMLGGGHSDARERSARAVNAVVASPGFTLANHRYSAANGWLLNTVPQMA